MYLVTSLNDPSPKLLKAFTKAIISVLNKLPSPSKATLGALSKETGISRLVFKTSLSLSSTLANNLPFKFSELIALLISLVIITESKKK